ncbi:MAG: aspartate carbamoyltransferase catalytic subunit, partial [Myxococcota bacterium]
MIAGQHLLGIRGLSKDAIHHILDTAEGFREISRRRIKKVPTLRGRTIVNAFFENSTRTRVSFELAAKRLSADGVNVSASGTSVAKGESLIDMAQTLGAMQLDAVVIRHGQCGAPHYLAERLDARIINAGDGQHEHPTQALLDLMTIRRHFRTLENLEVALVGDIAHSRVARSNLLALHAVGANIRVAGPSTLLPPQIEKAYRCTVCSSVAEAVEGAHVVMALRLQRERMVEGLLPSLREYASEFGVNAKLLETTRPEAILMHPGPVNRGVELAADVVDG